MPDRAGPRSAPRRFVGFYWTLPLPHLGFTRLPKDAAEAAASSRTIRYQRERVRRHVEARGGELLAEFTWLEFEPDRGSEFVAPELGRALALCRSAGAQLLYVDFAERHGWRPHAQLKGVLARHANPGLHRPLDPDPITIDGTRFDPVAHFRRWRRAMDERGTAAKRRHEVHAAILACGDALLPSTAAKADYAGLAARLNAEGIRTTTGRAWTSDNLRVFLRTMKGVPDGVAKIPQPCSAAPMRSGGLGSFELSDEEEQLE